MVANLKSHYIDGTPGMIYIVHIQGGRNAYAFEKGVEPKLHHSIK